jgi:hypothetical protein
MKKIVAELVILHLKTILFLEPWILFDQVSWLQQHHGVHEYNEPARNQSWIQWVLKILIMF